MTDPEVIEALGGHATVATALKVSRETALHWTKRVIPWKHRLAIQGLARRKRVKLPVDFLGEQRAA